MIFCVRVVRARKVRYVGETGRGRKKLTPRLFCFYFFFRSSHGTDPRPVPFFVVVVLADVVVVVVVVVVDVVVVVVVVVWMILFLLRVASCCLYGNVFVVNVCGHACFVCPCHAGEEGDGRGGTKVDNPGALTCDVSVFLFFVLPCGRFLTVLCSLYMYM